MSETPQKAAALSLVKTGERLLAQIVHKILHLKMQGKKGKMKLSIE